MTSAVRKARIARKTVEAVGICSFELVDSEGGTLPRFSAGAHIDVHLTGGVVRQYSLMNSPSETHRYLIGVLLDPASRGGSAGMHALSEGDTLHVSDPKNHFELVHDAKHSVLIAGGIGVTPLLCMAERLANGGASFEMHYCTRSRERTAFVDRLAGGSFANRVHLHHDDGPPAQKFDPAELMVGLDPAAHLYVCGPTGFMDWVLGAARSAGWSDAQLHREYFAAAPIDTSSDGSFEVQIASTGAVIRIDADSSVTAALAAHGIQIETSCEQGVCGTCLTRVLEGTPDHRDMYLTPAEQAKDDQFTPCCSRAKSPRLVLDL